MTPDDPAPIRGRWTEAEVAAMASRITRFGWPYVTNATAVVRQVIEEQDRLRPPVPDEAAIERGARLLEEWDLLPGDGPEDYRAVALAVLRAALETPAAPERHHEYPPSMHDGSLPDPRPEGLPDR